MSVGNCISLELLPENASDEVASRLRELLAESTRARGLIAFWTLPYDLLGPQLVTALSGGGFLCLDIHLPTNIDQVAALRRAGAEVYLHLYDLSGQTELPGTLGVPPHLMHAKTILFDLKNGRSVLWTGSHNATHRALYGVNIEASVLATLDRSSAVYREAEAFVESVRQRCQLFDLSLVGYYKWLQGDDHAENAIELEDALDQPLPNTTVITLFGTREEELQQLNKIDKEVLVSLTSSTSGRERFYRALIDKTGRMGGVDFKPCRYAFRDGSRLPLLGPHQVVDPSVTRRATYFVSLKLNEQLPESTRAFAPPEKRWAEVKDGHVADLLPERVRTNRRRDRDKDPKLRQAVSPDVFLHSERTLESRRVDLNRKLITRVVLNTGKKPQE